MLSFQYDVFFINHHVRNHLIAMNVKECVLISILYLIKQNTEI